MLVDGLSGHVRKFDLESSISNDPAKVWVLVSPNHAITRASSKVQVRLRSLISRVCLTSINLFLQGLIRLLREGVVGEHHALNMRM